MATGIFWLVVVPLVLRVGGVGVIVGLMIPMIGGVIIAYFERRAAKRLEKQKAADAEAEWAANATAEEVAYRAAWDAWCSAMNAEINASKDANTSFETRKALEDATERAWNALDDAERAWIEA